ncbi:MAG: LysR family transcriptional regulator [Alphaproteobacteria bacterium]|nr:LysR family transcriptional regulator [Alphaproteobacteria bacterium]
MDPLDRLRLFAGLVGCRSFAEAGRQMGVPRAQVSRAVQELELALSVRLVHRSTRAMHLTERGEAVAERAATILRHVDALQDVTAPADVPCGELRVAAPRNLGERAIVPILSAFAARYPDVRLRLTLRDRPVRLVEEGFDLAIRVVELEDSELIARRLLRCRVVLCASPGYLRRAGAPQAVADLAEHRCVVDTNYRMGSRWRFRSGATRRAVTVDPVLTCNSPEAVRRWLLDGHGVGFSNTIHIGDDLRAGRLVPVLPDSPVDARASVWAVTPSRRLVSAAVRALMAQLPGAIQARYPYDTTLEPPDPGQILV